MGISLNYPVTGKLPSYVSKYFCLELSRYFAKLDKICRYFGNTVINTLQQILIFEADTDFSMWNKTIIE